MNNRQCKKRSKKLNFILFEEEKIRGRKLYSYKAVHDHCITLGFTAKPKQKGCSAYSENRIIKELHCYGLKSAYEYNILF